MDLPMELEAQGTEIRVRSNKIKTATFGQAGTTVTVALAAHGLKAGDRIEVLTADDAVFPVGPLTVENVSRYTVGSASASTFTFTVGDDDAIEAGAAMTFSQMLSVSPKTFNGPGGSASVMDVTTLSSTAKRKRMGLMDEGQLGCTIHYVPGNEAHETLRTNRKARKPVYMEQAFSDGRTGWGFQGYVLSFPVTGSVDGIIESAVVIEIDGDIHEYTISA
jgi:hypothetical protein